MSKCQYDQILYIVNMTEYYIKLCVWIVHRIHLNGKQIKKKKYNIYLISFVPKSLGATQPKSSKLTYLSSVTMKTFLGLGVELIHALHIVQNILRIPFMRNATLRQKKLVFN